VDISRATPTSLLRLRVVLAVVAVAEAVVAAVVAKRLQLACIPFAHRHSGVLSSQLRVA
jgi:hypothetical protein